MSDTAESAGGFRGRGLGQESEHREKLGDPGGWVRREGKRVCKARYRNRRLGCLSPNFFWGHQQLLTSVPPSQILPPPARFVGSMEPERSVESQ